MFLTKNNTPLDHAVFPYTDKDSRNFVSVVIKGTFNIKGDGSLILADEQEPLLKTDEYLGEPSQSSLLREADFAPLKTAADVFVIGEIVTPDERPCTQLDAMLQVGQEKRMIRAVGDRVWHHDGFSARCSDIQPFTRIPLSFENAYGGCSQPQSGQAPEFYRANPIGKGFIGKHDDIDGVALPNLEHPGHPIKNPADKPPPCCPGSVNRSWQPRVAFAGTCDDDWQKQRAPLLPMDFDNRFYNAAEPNFIFPLLAGNETVVMQGFSADGPLHFHLPNWRIKIRYCLKNDISTLYAQMDTLTILANKNQLVLNWRVSFPCGLDMLYVKWLEIKPVYM